MAGLNLHSLVRGVIATVHPDEDVLLYQSTGSANVKGQPIPVYAPPQALRAQVQSENDEALQHIEKVNESDIVKRFYLTANAAMRPAGVMRPLSRGGDMIQRADGTWWLITGTIDDFSAVGWVAVRATMQTKGPDLSGGQP